MNIIGISAFYHDSAAVLISDGEILAAAQEERFTRVKHDSNFPINSIKFVISYSGVDINQIDALVFYDKPFLKIERLFETYAKFAPRGLVSFLAAMPVLIKEKLFLRERIINELEKIGLERNIDILFSEHHLSHAASAFFPSPYEEAAILTIDGVGEYATTTIGVGKRNRIEILKELHFPHSLGLLYSAFTYYTGFKVNSGEYKLMGLAPYGEPRFYELIRNELVDIKEDGSLRLNMKYFGFATSLKMINSRFERLFGRKRREPESEITQHDMDVAASIQKITDEVVLRLAKTARRLTGLRNLVLAGGVALNCVANGKILRESIFENIWIQPASSDAGGALGAALAYYYLGVGSERKIDPFDSMKGAFLGPEFSDDEIEGALKRYHANYQRFSSFEQLTEKVAQLLSEGKIVGWFQGRMEFGPRALGSRSILGDARNKEMQKDMNLKIKFRESFRPFAPAVLSEMKTEYFNISVESPYMLLVSEVSERHRKELSSEEKNLRGLKKLDVVRSDIPAVTHVDYTARIQTVDKDRNEKFYALLKKFYEITGCGVLINTSFNVRGEPIVCTPEDAYICFMNTNIDYLAIGNFLLDKSQQAYNFTPLKKSFILD
ncbi:MAG: carbamoyltransferase [Deltaproteobacteria bacterium]|nr:carbamoyltransferase [Deltaproteobacteria bacterium]